MVLKILDFDEIYISSDADSIPKVCCLLTGLLFTLGFFKASKSAKMGVAGAGSKTHPNSKIFWDMLVDGSILSESSSQMIL